MSPPGVLGRADTYRDRFEDAGGRTCRELLARSASAAAAHRWPIVPRGSWAITVWASRAR